MRHMKSLALVITIVAACQVASADEAELMQTISRNYAEAVARAELDRARAFEKARDEAVAELVRIAAVAHQAKNSNDETNAWKAVLKLDSSYQPAVRFFTDPVLLHKALAEISGTEQAVQSRILMVNPAFQSWVKEVASQPAEKQAAAVSQKMVALNPGFDGKLSPTIENGVVNAISFDSARVINLTPIRALVGLKTLTCGGNGTVSPLADLSPLQGLPLTFLSCRYTSVSDLTPLRGLALTQFLGDFTSIKDLSPLQGMPLTGLAVSATPVSDLRPLAGLKLISLACSSTPVVDLSPLKGMSLGSVHMNDTNVPDLSPLQGMPLTTISMMNTKVVDLSPLFGMQLTAISLSGTPVSDLSPLTGMPLSFLFCQRTHVTHLSTLRDMPLTALWCDIRQPADLAVLRSLRSLEKINDQPVADFLQKQMAPPTTQPASR